MPSDDDDACPGEVDPDLDALEWRALGAWRTIDPYTQTSCDDTEGARLEGGIASGFADRVMKAEAEAFPRLVTVDVTDPPTSPANDRPWRRRIFATVVGTASVMAMGSAVVPYLRGESGLGVGAPEPEATTSAVYATPEQVGTPGLSQQGTPGMPLPPDLDDRIEAYVAGYGKNWGPAFELHGVVLVARDGIVRYVRGFGIADRGSGIPNTPTTRFRLGLLTEQFTAAAIMQLRDDDLLDLGDPVAKFIPEYPEGHRITIEHLLSHTSGIPNYTDFPYFHTWKDRHHSTDEVLRRFGPEPLEFAPGTDFSPTNSGYFLLGAIIERVTGLSYGEYVAQNIFDPAGMTASTFGDAYETGEQARGNVWNEEETLDPPDPIDMSVFGGAGGLVATPLDLARWDAALYDGSLLDPRSAEEMMTPDESGYGYGWVVSEAYGQRLVSFPGAIDGFNGSMLRFTEDRTLVVVLCNTEVVPGAQIAHDVSMLVYGEDPPPRVEYREIEIAPGTYHKYVGAYGVTRRTREAYATVIEPERFDLLETVYVRQLGDRLYFDVPGHGMTWMHPMGHNRFFFKDHSGNTLGFHIDDDGPAHELTLHYQDAQFALHRK